MAGLEQSDLVVGNGTITSFNTSDSIATVAIASVADGAVTVEVPAHSTADIFGIGNTAPPAYSITFDGTAPTVSIVSLSGPFGGVFKAAITLPEPSTGFGPDGLVPGNAATTLTGS